MFYICVSLKENADIVLEFYAKTYKKYQLKKLVNRLIFNKFTGFKTIIAFSNKLHQKLKQLNKGFL